MNKVVIDLPEELFKRLTALAEAAGVSPDVYAGRMLMPQLENGEANWIRLEIEKLREDLAIATQAILLNNCDVEEADTRRWIVEKLLNR